MKLMSDVEILSKKNSEITKLRTFNAALVVVVMVLAAAGAFTVVLSRFQPPRANSEINVIDRKVLSKEGNTISVPKRIVAGEQFTYHTEGTKFYSNSAQVDFQTICRFGNIESITNVGSVPYSNVPKGDFDVDRVFVIPNNSKMTSSKDCKLQVIARYTFYQLDENGYERQIEIPETGISNTFELVVPEQNQDITQDKVGDKGSIPILPMGTVTVPKKNGNDGTTSETPKSETPSQPNKNILDKTLDGVSNAVRGVVNNIRGLL